MTDYANAIVPLKPPHWHGKEVINLMTVSARFCLSVRCGAGACSARARANTPPTAQRCLRPAQRPRDVKEVPFVELFDRRLQVVVSSGSGIQRVYVAFFEAGTLNFSCSTNNNRPCGGLRGSPCNHLRSLLDEAIAQYGIGRVVAFLRVPGDPGQYSVAQDVLARPGRAIGDDQTGSIFSRFLSHLELLELPAQGQPLPELAWFV